MGEIFKKLQDHNLTMDYDWITRVDFSKYEGQWVIVLDRKVVASGDAQDIKKKLVEIRKEFPKSRPLLLKVPEKVLQIV